MTLLPSYGMILGMLMMLKPFFSVNEKVATAVGSLFLIGLCLRKVFKLPTEENPAIIDLGARLDRMVEYEYA